MTPTEPATRFARPRPWSRNGERAVHKPLLALLLLGRIANGQSSPVTFDAIATHRALRQSTKEWARLCPWKVPAGFPSPAEDLREDIPLETSE